MTDSSKITPPEIKEHSLKNVGPEKSLRGRLRAVKPTRWVRFGIVSLIFLTWVVLMGNPWLLLLWLLLIDIYLTGYIPFTWWKKKTGATRTVMAWVDAIVYALILIYFIFAFIGQQYEIPSSSLEKSLLVGDRLWVDKTVYGARVPQTPIHFPLAQHTLPFLNTKSYVENPQLEYHRMPGRRGIERGDIVVFNYPQGDTVALGRPNDDYYMMAWRIEQEGGGDGRKYIASHPGTFGQVVWRPVDRRENYVKRAIGLPGERLRISNDSIFINGSYIAEPEHVQFNYIVPVSGPIAPEKWLELGVRADDHRFEPLRNEPGGYSFYDVPLTREMKAEVEKWPEVIAPLRLERESGLYDLGGVFPLGNDYGWTRPDMGEFWIPKRGSTLHLTLDNLPIYERAIRVYEDNDLSVRDGKIYINGEQTDYYTFKLDYYWMMGDNRDRSADSRYWGFVPEDHIVGSPVFIILSLDQERSLSDGKIRWDRILRNPNPDKSGGKWPAE
ncbi:MAG: signal peptidase I [Muribaculaceae bacterium]|nr:signal peptidase I [Muribaculaceae bacterium]